MKYSEQDMAALISEVEAHFAENLAKAEADKEGETLQKSEETKVGSQEAATQEVEGMQKSEETVQDFDYDEEDIAEMDKMYSSMTKSEAAAHLESIQRALGVESEEVESQEMQKSEETEQSEEKLEKSTEEAELLKSEVSDLKKENEELKKSFESLTSALTKFVKKGSSAPKQKAITRIEYIAKSEDEKMEKSEEKEDVTKLSKSEISNRLSQKIREGKLEKTDREKIDEYYLDNANLETIKHLLV